jgi:hypothetical protein
MKGKPSLSACAFCRWVAGELESNCWWYAGKPAHLVVVTCHKEGCQDRANSICNRIDYGDNPLGQLVIRHPRPGHMRGKSRIGETHRPSRRPGVEGLIEALHLRSRAGTAGG